MTIVRNPAAPTVASDDPLTHPEAADLLDGAVEICATHQDNDAEAWYVTPAGQILRRTGSDLDRVFVVPEEEAFDVLSDMASDAGLARAWSPEELARLRSAPQP